MNITSHQEHTFESYVEWVLFGGHIAPITKFALESVGELPPEETSILFDRSLYKYMTKMRGLKISLR